MKSTELKATITVGPIPKKFALLVSILDTLYCGDREKLIRQLVRWYQVTL